MSFRYLKSRDGAAELPSEATMGWLRGMVGEGSAIESVTLMSVSSTVLHAVDVLDELGERHALVLRRFR